jgi:hypothetical protein
MNNIKEEIKRIKSLFNEERLYGNIINEGDCDDCSKSEMIQKLNSSGYMIRKRSSVNNNRCEEYDKNNWLDVINTMKSLASTNNIGDVSVFQDSGYGCSLSLQYTVKAVGAKNKSKNKDMYINIQLWADGDWAATKEAKTGNSLYDIPQKTPLPKLMDVTKLYMSGTWIWETDHIAFTGELEKYKVIVKDETTNVIDKAKSEKYNSVTTFSAPSTRWDSAQIMLDRLKQ